MKQYLELCQRIVDEGTWIENERTGKRCLTVINADLTYDVDQHQAASHEAKRRHPQHPLV